MFDQIHPHIEHLCPERTIFNCDIIGRVTPSQMEVEARRGGHHRTKVISFKSNITIRIASFSWGKYAFQKTTIQVRHLPPVEKPLPLTEGGIIGGENIIIRFKQYHTF